MGTFLDTVEAPTKWGPELKEATALTSRSMITPFLESFPEDFSVEVDGDTYTALLATEPAQPARWKKKAAAPRILKIRRAGAAATRTTTRTRRASK